ncbi:hypothetical protein [Acinetobacter sp.]|jgi:hypothetical protein|uniref:hypothetical protein n=1 Tax=Acinetobacter sp. TaxID=472 RepID=UPI0035E3CA2A
MRKILISLITSSVVCFVHADDFFKKVQSDIFIQNNEPQYKNDKQQVDFFELSRQQELERINQRDANVVKMHENRANTSNMSPFERSQYFLKNSDTQALNAYVNEQQLESFQKARNRGAISEQDYQQKLIKQKQMPLQLNENQLKFTPD